MASTSEGSEKIGIAVLEVFNIIYLGNDEVVEQDGFIKISSGGSDDGQAQYLYNVKQIDSNAPTIKYGDDIAVMAGPISFGPISFDGDEELKVEYDLFSHDYKGQELIRWLPRCPNEVDYSWKGLQSVDKTGNILLLLGYFGNATIANIQVQLFLDKDSVYRSNVSGVIAASNSLLDLPDCTTILFAKKPGHGIAFPADGVIPLSKCRVGLPIDSDLFLDVSLTLDGENHVSTFCFGSQIEGQSLINATTSTKAKFVVKVTWVAAEYVVNSKDD